MLRTSSEAISYITLGARVMQALERKPGCRARNAAAGMPGGIVMDQIAAVRQKADAAGHGVLEFGSGSEYSEIERIPIDELSVLDSPRIGGEDFTHVRALSEVITALPPIVVHRQTMTVVDGAHRLRAAQRSGAEVIDAVYFDGDAREAFVIAVRMNSAHGLPLSLADRKAAATRILGDYPEWSNRRVADVVGLSDKTVGAIRRGADAEYPQQPDARMGRDGVMYPVEAGERRRRALEFLADKPGASAKEVALATGVSLTTAKKARRDVRESRAAVAGRDEPGADTGTGGEPGVPNATPPADPQAGGRRGSRDTGAIVRRLRADPSLRFTEYGRKLLRMLEALPVEPAAWQMIVDSIPMHCAPTVAELARRHAVEWQNLAERLARKADLDRIS
ncbi:ParB/RepB/Spo0J family partition protein [Nocardia brasiliensis]|uniref:ParB/RepB/Spo0J family partition protein n=1 Tax=Nocardia brasiliensis TaxID=37326 RepID=UPI001D02CC57|nr:ParB N-terminal domain-containing protein [Nocardia brasiliensis]